MSIDSLPRQASESTIWSQSNRTVAFPHRRWSHHMAPTGSVSFHTIGNRIMRRATTTRHSHASKDAADSSQDDTIPTRNDSVDDRHFHQLLAAARGGCRETQGKVLESLRTYLLMTARSQVRPGDRPQLNESDLVQHCHLNAVNAFHNFQGSTKRELQGWLKRILLNVLATERRLQQRPMHAQKFDQSIWGSLVTLAGRDHTDDSTPSSALIRNEREERLQELLGQLSERSRQIIRLRQFQKLSFPEIAENLGCSSNAACHAWMRALEELGRKVGPESEW